MAIRAQRTCNLNCSVVPEVSLRVRLPSGINQCQGVKDADQKYFENAELEFAKIIESIEKWSNSSSESIPDLSLDKDGTFMDADELETWTCPIRGPLLCLESGASHLTHTNAVKLTLSQPNYSQEIPTANLKDSNQVGADLVMIGGSKGKKALSTALSSTITEMRNSSLLLDTNKMNDIKIFEREDANSDRRKTCNFECGKRTITVSSKLSGPKHGSKNSERESEVKPELLCEIEKETAENYTISPGSIYQKKNKQIFDHAMDKSRNESVPSDSQCVTPGEKRRSTLKVVLTNPNKKSEGGCTMPPSLQNVSQKSEVSFIVSPLNEVNCPKFRINQVSGKSNKLSPFTAAQGSSFEVRVPPLFMCNLQDQESDIGMTAVFRCEVIGSPQPRISWFKDSALITDSIFYKHTYNGRVATLKVFNTCPADQGLYKCEAENEAGKVATTGRLTVCGSAPNMIFPVNNVTAQRGQLAFMKCSFTGHPLPDIYWKKQGRLLHSSKKTGMTIMGNVSQLEIRGVATEDEGFYECLAVNIFGDALCGGYLRVEEPTIKMDAKKSGLSRNKQTFCSSRCQVVEGDQLYKIPICPPYMVQITGNQSPYFEIDMKNSNPELQSPHKSSCLQEQTCTSEKPTTMPSYDHIDDEEVLYKMMNESDDFDERKKIRERVREVREQKKKEWDVKKQESAKKFDVVKQKQQQAEEDKQRRLKLLKEQSAAVADERSSRQPSAVKSRQQVAEEGKQRKMESFQRLAKHETSESKNGVTTKTTTTTMTGLSDDGGTTTTVTKKTTITKTSVGEAAKPTGAKSAMASFRQLDAANPSKSSLAPAGRGGGGSKIVRSPSAIKQMLLDWCKAMTKEYTETINITNFSSSWNNGIAFCALIHHFYPESFDFSKLNPKNRRSNFTLAFDTAEKYADIAPLLDVDDMVKMKNPDWKCVFTYVQSFYRKLHNFDANKKAEQS